jgi:hypothetical protein
MAPSKFADLCKPVNDLFSKDFGAGAQKLTLKSKTSSGVAFKLEGSRKDAKAVDASLESKFTYSGVDVTETWKSDNSVKLALSVKDQLTKGTKIGTDLVFNPTGKLLKSFALKTDYSTDAVTFNATTTKDGSEAGIVVAAGKFNVGASTKVSSSFAFSKSAIALAYAESDYSVTTVAHSDGQSSGLCACVHQKVSSDVEAGAQLCWDSKTSATSIGVAAKVKCDQDAFYKVKVDQNAVVGLGYTQKIRDGVAVTLGAEINAAQLNAGAHKLGFHLNIDA